MPHLEVLEWDYADRLQHTLRSNGSAQDTYFTYDGIGQRVRKVYVHDGIADERIYLGGVELFRRRSVDGSGVLGTVSVERETLHVMDDTRRVAMAETLTVDTGGTEPISVGQTRWRYQLDDHLSSSAMELDDAAQVISYEEYHPYGSTAFHLFSGNAEVFCKALQVYEQGEGRRDGAVLPWGPVLRALVGAVDGGGSGGARGWAESVPVLA